MKTLTCFSILLVFITLIGCNQNERLVKSFSLNGKIVGQDTGKIFIMILSDSVIHDSTEIVNGKFVFKGMIREPTMVRLYTDNDLNQTRMYIESGKMDVILNKNDFKNYKLTGSKTNDEEKVLINMLNPIYDRMQKLEDEHSINEDSIGKSSNESIKKVLEEKNELIDNELKTIEDEIIKEKKDFIIAHPKSYISIETLRLMGATNELTIDSLRQELSKMDKALLESRNGKMLLNDIRKKENILVGAVAPDFSVIDINNQRITLSQFKGKKVVIIDFWASWCIPCRESLSHLKKTYSKYHSKGLEVIAVGYLDFSKETWKKAVLEDSIHLWINTATVFRNEDPMNLSITNNYFIAGIPFILLIDKEGKIAGNWGGYSAEIAESIDEKLEKMLND